MDPRFLHICFLLGYAAMAHSLQVSPRYEINDIMSQPVFSTQRDLLVLALREALDMDPSDPLSFYQIGGIHGMPARPWKNITNQTSPYDATTAAADRARIEYLNGLIDRTKQKINAEGGLTDFFANPVKAFNPVEFGIKFEELADARAELVNSKKYQDEIATLQERTYATGLEGLVKTTQATKDEI